MELLQVWCCKKLWNVTGSQSSRITHGCCCFSLLLPPHKGCGLAEPSPGNLRCFPEPPGTLSSCSLSGNDRSVFPGSLPVSLEGGSAQQSPHHSLEISISCQARSRKSRGQRHSLGMTVVSPGGAVMVTGMFTVVVLSSGG